MAEGKSNSDKAEQSSSDPKVLGIGGIIFYSDDPERTREWYSDTLGFELNDWGGASFEYRNPDNPDRVVSQVWKPIDRRERSFIPSRNEFMVNLRVQNIEGLLAKLKEKNIKIIGNIKTYEGIGKFVHILDIDGNKVELWEPEEG